MWEGKNNKIWIKPPKGYFSQLIWIISIQCRGLRIGVTHKTAINCIRVTEVAMCYKISKYNQLKLRLIFYWIWKKKYNSLKDHLKLTSQKHQKIIMQKRSMIQFFSSQFLLYSLFSRGRKKKCFQGRDQNCSNFRERAKNKIPFQHLVDSTSFFLFGILAQR